jgi:hypothetical protein
MQTEYTLDFILENTGCYEGSKIENLFPKEKEVISYKNILQSNIPLGDKYWFFCNRVFTKEQNRQIAIIVAETVLPIHEERYPKDTRARKAIEAAKLYLSGHISLEQLLTARKAAAAYTTYATYNAAVWTTYASTEADAAWNADAWVAYAAVKAAFAAIKVATEAATEAADAKYTKELEQLLITFIENNE